MKNVFKFGSFISFLRVIFLLLVFNFLGEYAVIYFGVLLFFYSGYQDFDSKNWIIPLGYYALTIMVFISILFLQFTLKISTPDEITFPPLKGFFISIIACTISLIFGFMIKVLFKNKVIGSLLFYSLLSILLIRFSLFLGKPFSSSFSGLVTLYFYYKLSRETTLSKTVIAIALLFPFALIFIPLSDIKGVTIAAFLFMVVSIALAMVLSNVKKSLYFKILVITFVILAIGNYVFMMNWTEHVYSKYNQLPETIFSEEFIDENGRHFSSSDFKGKVVVLDLWTTSCSICFKKFPEFEKFYQQNKNQPDLLVYVVGIPYQGEKDSTLFSMINRFNYSFPKLLSKHEYPFYHEYYNILGVPAIIILDKNGELVYNGRFNNNPFILANNLQNKVDELLKED